MAIESPVRCTVVYAGHVQGVGFRHSVTVAIGSLPITGYVLNEPTGTVRLVAEGGRSTVSELIRRVRARMGAYITEAHETWGTATGEFPTFEVKRA